MSKILVLIRHAKADSQNRLRPGDDLNRPLSDRGISDAQNMGALLRDTRLIPDAILCSPAARTRSTALLIAEQTEFDPQQIHFSNPLYLADDGTIIQEIQKWDDSINTGFVVCHNPGISVLANLLWEDFQPGNMPTCGLVAARVPLHKWKEFHPGNQEIFLFEYPKKTNDRPQSYR